MGSAGFYSSVYVTGPTVYLWETGNTGLCSTVYVTGSTVYLWKAGNAGFYPTVYVTGPMIYGQCWALLYSIYGKVPCIPVKGVHCCVILYRV